MSNKLKDELKRNKKAKTRPQSAGAIMGFSHAYFNTINYDPIVFHNPEDIFADVKNEQYVKRKDAVNITRNIKRIFGNQIVQKRVVEPELLQEILLEGDRELVAKRKLRREIMQKKLLSTMDDHGLCQPSAVTHESSYVIYRPDDVEKFTFSSNSNSNSLPENLIDDKPMETEQSDDFDFTSSLKLIRSMKENKSNPRALKKSTTIVGNSIINAINVNDINASFSTKPILKKSQSAPLSQPTTALSKIDMVLRRREEILVEEERSKFLLIERRRLHVLERNHLMQLQHDKKQRGQFWSKLVNLLFRTQYLSIELLKHRDEVSRLDYFVKASVAVTFVIRWWRFHKLKKMMAAHARFVKVIRGAATVYWRKMKVRQNRSAALLLWKYLRDCKGFSEKTQKIYKYRKNLLKAKKLCSNFVICTRARIQLLELALERSIKKARIKRAHVLTYNERLAVKNTRSHSNFFITMKKIEKVQEALNQEYEVVLKIQKEIDPTKYQEAKSGLDTKTCMDYFQVPYYGTLRSILTARRRIVVIAEFMHEASVIAKSKQTGVDISDVKNFLTTPDYAMVFQEFKVVTRVPRRPESFPLLLLTGEQGALKAIDQLAHKIVLYEEKILQEKTRICSNV